MLSFLSETDILVNTKQVSDEMVILRADITSLERQRGFLHRLQELRKEIGALDRRAWKSTGPGLKLMSRSKTLIRTAIFCNKSIL